MHSLWQDLRYGLRQWKSSPGFAAVAVISLGLGIGANSAIFQLVDAVRLRTLPVERPAELAYIDFKQGSRRSGWFSTRSARLTHIQWEELGKRQQAFAGLAAWSAARFNLAEGGEARYAEGMYVNGDFFRVLGVRAERGRLLTVEDDRGDCFYGAVISEAFWQREYGGDAGVLGRKITLEGRPFEVIGVTAPAFFGVEVGRRYDVAIPLCADKALDPRGKGRKDIRHAWWLSAMGRLKPGWTVAKAKSHLEALSPGLMEATVPEEYKSDTVAQYRKNKLEATAGETGVSQLRRQYEQPLWLLLATTGLVLLIACANVANLLLARASVREREVAVRLAMGASRQRLVRQLFLESLLLAMGGALVGLVLAQALSGALVSYLSTANNPVFVNVGWDWRVLGFTSAVAFGTCLLFGLMPAWRATQVAPASAMRTGGRGSTSGRDRNTLRRVLVATQIALSMVLLVGALLFSGSLRRLLNTDAGFASDALLAVTVDWRQAPADNRERLLATFRDVKQKLESIPGVTGAAEVSIVPLSGSGWNNNVGPDNTTAAASGKESFFNRVGPGYFRTMGTPVLAGREMDDRDTLGSAKVAVVNEMFAAKHFGGGNPVGRTFRQEAPAGKPEPLYQVVGLVKNTKYYGVREEFLPIAYLPAAQEEDPRGEVTFVLRFTGPVGSVMSGVRQQVAAVQPGMGILFRPMSRQVEESLQRDRLMAALSGAFGMLAGTLATLGLYGVVAYMVTRRRNEIGVRMALGADRWRVQRLVLREAGVLVAAGLVVGTLLALWAGQAAATLLYGLKPWDVPTLVAAGALLSAVALGASYWPARRASGMDPMAALREE